MNIEDLVELKKTFLNLFHIVIRPLDFLLSSGKQQESSLCLL